jgi:hypothetical protein
MFCLSFSFVKEKNPYLAHIVVIFLPFFNFQDNLPQKCLVMGIFSSKQLVMQNWLSPLTFNICFTRDKNAISYHRFVSAEASRENSK